MTATLYLHGSCSSPLLWTPFLTEGPHERPALPGCLSLSPLPDPAGWTLLTDLDVADQALSRLEGPVTLVAHSFGGFLALHLARRHPDRIRQVIAHEPVLWPILGASGEPLDPAWVASILAAEGGGDEAWLTQFTDWWGGEGSWARLPSRLRRMMVERGRKSWLEVRAVFSDPTPMTAWAELAVPVRITVGTETPALARRALELLAALGPDVVLKDVPGGHLALLTHPEAVREAWAEWV